MKKTTMIAAGALCAATLLAEVTPVIDASGNYVFDLSSDDTYSSDITWEGATIIKTGVGKLTLTGK